MEGVIMLGAATAWSFNVSRDANEVFKNATKGLFGVKYTPLAHSSQVVNGLNHLYLCEAQPLTQGIGQAYPVVMHVFEPFDGAPRVTNIKKLGPPIFEGPGGWSTWSFKLTTDAQKAFDKALHGFFGATYKPLAFTMQVVTGLNYCFLCECHTVVVGMPTFAALVYVNQPLPSQGEPHIVEIQDIPTN